MWAPLLVLSFCSFCFVSSQEESECMFVPDKYDKAAMLSRNAVYGRDNMWPKGVVPFAFGSSFPQDHLRLIYSSMRHIEKRSCVRFVKRKGEKTYVNFINTKSGCNTRGLGYDKNRGATQLNLQPSGCMYKHTIVHELLHALGFMHEQNRPDRDQYIQVVWKNIVPKLGEFYQFARARGRNEQIPKCNLRALSPYDDCYNGLTANTFGMPYDYQSVMQYSRTAFSKNGRPTMVPLYRTGALGNKRGLTKTDIRKLGAAYNCNSQATPPPRPPTESCVDYSPTCPSQINECSGSMYIRGKCPKTCRMC